jgi:hypothetical protein
MNRREAQSLLTNLEFVKAFAEGQSIQCRQKGTEEWLDLNDPCFDGADIEYRTKPGPIEGWVNVYPDGKSAVFHSTRQRADDASVHGRIKCVFVREVEGK